MSIFVTVAYAEMLFVGSQALHAQTLSVNIQHNTLLQLSLFTASKAPTNNKKKNADNTSINFSAKFWACVCNYIEIQKKQKTEFRQSAIGMIVTLCTAVQCF